MALTAYLNLKAKTFYFDIHDKSNTKQDAIVKEIQRLTTNPNPANIAIVSSLQLQLQQERSRLADISAYYPKTATESKSQNV